MDRSLTEQLAKPHIHYGSIEEKIRHVLDRHNEGMAASSGVTYDDLNSLKDDAHMETSVETKLLLEEFEKKKRAREIAVPTDDGRVKAKLREYGEPICLFGEGPAERRDRLRAKMAERLGLEPQMEEVSSGDSDEEMDEEFYTEGSNELLTARRAIAAYSIKRAKKRIEEQKKEQHYQMVYLKKARQSFFDHISLYENYSSQIADERPVSTCAFSPNSKLVATGAWSGLVKLWSIPDCKSVMSFRGHVDRVGGLAFHPKATLGQSPESVNLVSGGADGSVCLWSLTQDTPIASLVGHELRVARVAFHPTGDYVGTASYDGTWRLWDVQTQKELLLQEGHSQEVHCISFHPDGSLAATGSLSCHGRVWDLRTGRSILVLQGHAKPIYAVDVAPNGYQIATGSEDNTIRIHDLRMLKCNYETLAAHHSVVTHLKFYHPGDSLYQEDGLSFLDALDNGGDVLMEDAQDALQKMKEKDKGGVSTRQLLQTSSHTFLASCSYDGTTKLWSSGDWKLQKTLKTDGGKTMCVDIAKDLSFLVTSTYDRTFKLWSKNGY